MFKREDWRGNGLFSSREKPHIGLLGVESMNDPTGLLVSVKSCCPREFFSWIRQHSVRRGDLRGRPLSADPQWRCWNTAEEHSPCGGGPGGAAPPEELSGTEDSVFILRIQQLARLEKQSLKTNKPNQINIVVSTCPFCSWLSFI